MKIVTFAMKFLESIMVFFIPLFSFVSKRIRLLETLEDISAGRQGSSLMMNNHHYNDADLERVFEALQSRPDIARKITTFGLWHSKVTNATGSLDKILRILPNLKVFCGSDELTTIDVTGNPKLEILHCCNNKLKTINITRNVKLKEVYLNGNQLKVIDLQRNVELEVFFCRHNRLKHLDLTNLLKLKVFYCTDNALKTINLHKNKKLNMVNLNKNDFSLVTEYLLEKRQNKRQIKKFRYIYKHKMDIAANKQTLEKAYRKAKAFEPAYKRMAKEIKKSKPDIKKDLNVEIAEIRMKELWSSTDLVQQMFELISCDFHPDEMSDIKKALSKRSTTALVSVQASTNFCYDLFPEEVKEREDETAVTLSGDQDGEAELLNLGSNYI